MADSWFDANPYPGKPTSGGYMPPAAQVNPQTGQTEYTDGQGRQTDTYGNPLGGTRNMSTPGAPQGQPLGNQWNPADAYSRPLGGARQPIDQFNDLGSSPSGGAPTLNRHDPASVQAFIQYYATQPGANPSLARDPGYWQQKISSGELGDDPGYAVSKFMTPEGAPAGQSGGGTPGMGPFTGNPQDFTTDPSYQWRLGQGLQSVQQSAAAGGRLFTGGTLKALNDYAQGAASQEWGAQFNRGLAVNQNNFNQNYSLAGLGLNATTAGINGANGVASNATSFAGVGQNNANTTSDLLTQGGNANAAGIIGNQNAWNGLYGNLGNLARRY